MRSMKRGTRFAALRKTYRHGDLRRALLDCAIELAKESGPDAVVLREATRRAGVVPNAAYRHFENRAALFDAVRDAALSAMAVAMEKRLIALGPERAGLEYARAALRAVGVGYLHFARKETGLFRTAFAVQFDLSSILEQAQVKKPKRNPFQLLSASLDRLERCGGLPAERRRDAEYLAWSAVHGMAMLSIDGPLRRRPVKQFNAMGRRLLDMVERGL
jgi:AcrR family transcriptional regulator